MGKFELREKATSDDFRNEEAVLFPIDSDEVNKIDLTKITELMQTMKDAGHKGKNKLIATFTGYDYDKREVYLIPEIRRYVSAITVKYPEIFYFLSIDAESLNIFLLCLFDVQEAVNTGNGKHDISVKIDYNVLKKIDDAVFTYGKSVNDDCIFIPSSLFGVSQKNSGYNSDEQTIFNELAYSFWDQLQTIPLKRVDRAGLKKFIDKNRETICSSIEQGFTILLDTLTSPVNIYNLFVAYGNEISHTCRRCQTKEFLIYKPSTGITGTKVVWLPSLSHYRQNHIELASPEFCTRIPIPIDPDKDKWICPKCGEIHSFRYSNNKLFLY